MFFQILQQKLIGVQMYNKKIQSIWERRPFLQTIKIFIKSWSFVWLQMEWLSAEEKSRSMMPYLLDLPPLDQAGSDLPKAQITDIPSHASNTNLENKTKPKKKDPAKEIDMEKWHEKMNCDLDRKPDSQPVRSKSDADKIDCDTKHLYKIDFKISTSKKYIALSDHDMAVLRRLSQRLVRKL